MPSPGALLVTVGSGRVNIHRTCSDYRLRLVLASLDLGRVVAVDSHPTRFLGVIMQIDTGTPEKFGIPE